MKGKFLLEVDGLSLREAGRYILKDISFRILPEECWTFTGPSESGKSTLLRSIARYPVFSNNIFFENPRMPIVKHAGHQHQFHSFNGISDFYYQQRFNASESANADSPMEDLMKVGDDKVFAMECLTRLQIDHLADSPMIRLSNGEHKRFQIAKALFEKADWLLLDNPYTGLDEGARKLLDRLLSTLISEGVHCILVTSGDIPAFVTHVATLKNGIMTGVHTREKFLTQRSRLTAREQKITISDFPAPEKPDFEYAVRMKNVTVLYNNREVLSQINWQVKSGDKWSISGPNGSGKSTLLSLITGDNPQAFANELYLFDVRRGSGETIWDIKKRIGFISPELHQFFDRSVSCFKVIASGFFDTIGLFRVLKKDQAEKIEHYMELFGLEKMADKPLGALSHGMQRWVLLARALVKNPPMIVLDEPCQGLDDNMKVEFIDFISNYCNDAHRTLLYVTHHKEEIPACVSKSVQLSEGKILEIHNNEKEHYSHSGRWSRA